MAKKTDKEIVEWWRTAAWAWFKLMPPCIRRTDGGLSVRLPPAGSDEQFLEAGFERCGDTWAGGNSPRDIAARELIDATEAVAAVAARRRISAGAALRFAELLRRAQFPSLMHYQQFEDTEFLVMEIEKGLEVDAKEPVAPKLQTKRQQEKQANLNRVRELLSQPEWKDAKQGALAAKLGIPARTLRDYLIEIRRGSE